MWFWYFCDNVVLVQSLDRSPLMTNVFLGQSQIVSFGIFVRVSSFLLHCVVVVKCKTFIYYLIYVLLPAYKGKYKSKGKNKNKVFGQYIFYNNIEETICWLNINLQLDVACILGIPHGILILWGVDKCATY